MADLAGSAPVTGPRSPTHPTGEALESTAPVLSLRETAARADTPKSRTKPPCPAGLRLPKTVGTVPARDAASRNLRIEDPAANRGCGGRGGGSASTSITDTPPPPQALPPPSKNRRHTPPILGKSHPRPPARAGEGGGCGPKRGPLHPPQPPPPSPVGGSVGFTPSGIHSFGSGTHLARISTGKMSRKETKPRMPPVPRRPGPFSFPGKHEGFWGVPVVRGGGFVVPLPPTTPEPAPGAPSTAATPPHCVSKCATGCGPRRFRRAPMPLRAGP